MPGLYSPRSQFALRRKSIAVNFPPAGTTPVGDNLDLVWDVQANVADNNQLVWDVRIPVADTTQLVWDVLTPVADTSQLVWDVLTPVADTTQLVWDLRANLADNNQLVWDVRANIADNNQLVWDVRTPVADNNQLVWDVRTAIADTIALLWDDLMIVGGVDYLQVLDHLTQSFDTGGTSHLVDMPATVVAGQKLLVAVGVINATVATPTDWDLLDNDASSDMNVYLFTKTADGSEGGTQVDFVTSVNRRLSIQLYRFSGDPAIDFAVATGINDRNPDPPSNTASWGSGNNLFLYVIGFNNIDTPSDFPDDYIDNTHSTSVGGG